MSASSITKLATYEEIRRDAVETFRQHFGSGPELASCAPGRVNLIGEHVDYNDGYVLPMALPMVTLFVGGQRADDVADIITLCPHADEPRRVQFSVQHLQHLEPAAPKWANYVKGVLYGFGNAVKGFNAVIASNVPVGAGLSSSAALEVATLIFLEQYAGAAAEKSDAERALICQSAEHKFVGVPCGIMDQMIALRARRDHALLLDCRTLESFQIPFVADEQSLIVLICNSDVHHELSNSEYPIRRKQCTAALKLMELKSYRDAREDCLSALEQTDEVLMRRARHVITEIKRTEEAVVALRAHDFKKLGELMTVSHLSLRDDFQVSCPELDVLVEAAVNCPGVLGSRMTGGGFGGCTVTLLRRDAVEDAISTMRASFIGKFNKSAGNNIEFYTCSPSVGARCVSL